MPRDWKKIETDYMGGNLSYAKIAEKWGVSVRQVEEHGRKNHWTEKRREFRPKRGRAPCFYSADSAAPKRKPHRDFSVRFFLLI